MVLTVGDRFKEMRSSDTVAQNDPNQPVPMTPPADVTGMPVGGGSGHEGTQGTDENDNPIAGGSAGDTPVLSERDREREAREEQRERKRRQDFEEFWQEHIVTRAAGKVGQDKLATLVLRGLPDSVSPFDIEQYIKSHCRVTEVDTHPSMLEEEWFLVSPAPDLDAVASSLNLGKVTSIDRDARRIFVEVDKSRFNEWGEFADSEKY
jgi:hypothetical protein